MERRFELQEDVVIKKGTILRRGPFKVVWNEECFETTVGIHKDGTATFILGISDIELRPDMFKEVTKC
jgi:hypothetical protein